jgi:predicted nuclease of predicted toxin-antitoxin system
MKVLLDSCVWGGVKPLLLAAGYDTVWTGEEGRDPGDEEILKRSVLEGRILITLDKDFGELIFLEGKIHCGIIRLASIPSPQSSFLHSRGSEQTS